MSLRLTDLFRGGADATGVPLTLALDSIEEDPDQPRTEFDDESLAELAETIKLRGVRQPVSVRKHPQQPGRYILNFGARRLRAAKLAEEVDIPAFVDEPVDAYDQVIENEQRKGLKPLELARFIKRRLVLGESQADIARQLGKSEAYVSYVCALVDAPDWLLRVYQEGKCRGAGELYHLRRLHAQAAERVEECVDRRAVITRGDVQQLKAELAAARSNHKNTPATATADVEPGVSLPAPAVGEPDVVTGAKDVQLAIDFSDVAVVKAVKAGPKKQREGLFAQTHGGVVEIVFDSVPEVRGHVFVRAKAGSAQALVPVTALMLIGFLPVAES